MHQVFQEVDVSRTRLEKIMARFLENAGEKERFRHALMNHGGDGEYSVEGQSVYLWARQHLETIQPRQHTFEAAACSTLASKPGRATRLYPVAGAVVAHLRYPADAGTDFVAYVPDKVLEAVCMRLQSPEQRLDDKGNTIPLSPRTDGLRTAFLALRCLYLPQSAKDMAATSGVSATRIRGARQNIVQRLELSTPLEATGVMRDDLVRTLYEMADAQTKRDHSDLATYHERFLAPYAQLRFLPDPIDASGRIIPVITMGPKDGKPLVALHAMMLPDLGLREAALFEANGIQAFFPLRHGALDSNAPDLKPQEHLEDAVRGIAAIAALLGEEKFHLAAMVTSSKIALEYAKLHPDRVSGLSFLAACVWKDRPDEGARAISKALVTGVKSAAFQWRSITRFMIDDLLGPERFKRFIKRHFEEAGPDAEIVDHEARNWPGVERMRYALRTPLASVRHDFLHQDELEWERARDLQIPMIFHHGTEDRIHPIDLIERLADGLPSSRVNRVPGGGQLLYYEHFTPVLKEIAAEIKKTAQAKKGG